MLRPLLGLLLSVVAFVGPAAPDADARRPNVVIILTDDQRADGADRMPNVAARLAGRGVTFENAFATNPLCCPSRTTILTGRYSAGTGVWSNRTPFGALTSFRASGAESRTIAVALRRAGYRTAFFGKYLNRYIGPRVPPGWSSWTSFWAGWRYFDYSLNVNGRRARYGDAPADYSTDLLARRAARFIRAARRPFFLYFSPAAPHAPTIPAPRHATTPLELAPFAPPNLYGADLSDKPRYVRETARPPRPTDLEYRERQYRSLLAVDDAVGRILDALKASGQLRRTLIVFTSDNGVQWGEHGFPAARKSVPYEGSIRVPLVVRYDAAVPRARRNTRLVTNVDLAPTVADAAGIRFRADGRSLIALVRNRRVHGWRQHVLIENMGGEVAAARIPTYCGVRTARWTYVLYATNEEELYDLEADPYQLENAAARTALEGRKLALRRSLGRLCFPTPPGYLPRRLCTVRGTRGSDVLRGGPGADAVCLRGGRDLVGTGNGADTVYAAASTAAKLARATFRARSSGPRGSRIRTGRGDDRILARNDRRDLIGCGRGRDRVVADRFDVVAPSCERVARPPSTGAFLRP